MPRGLIWYMIPEDKRDGSKYGAMIEMSKLIEFEMDGPVGKVLVEVPDTSAGGIQSIASNDEGVSGKAAKKFEDVLANVAPISNKIFSSFMSMTSKPTELSVEIGFKITAKGNLIIAASEGEASFKAVLKWQASKDLS